MGRFVLSSLLLSVFASSAFAQTTGTQRGRNHNLGDCLAGLGMCDRSLLSKTQASQIAEEHRDQNLWVCLTGYGECDHSILTATESKAAAAAEHRRNLLACESMIGVCDESLLTPAQADKVTEIDRQRNRLNCETGSGFDYSLLTPVEAAKARDLEREQSACVSNGPTALRHDVAEADGGNGGCQPAASKESSGLQDRE